MSELLLPAGNKDAFYAAISNGADAIYLGINKFSARAYANNFSIDELEELVKYAHLRKVKIYVTLNTILYDDELHEVFKLIDQLSNIYVDGIIFQDLAILYYITNNYLSLEAHASTQIGVDDYYGAKLFKDLNVKRIVFARETPIEVIKDIKDKLNIEVEVFAHGALCVCYSGNCLMSSMIGDRSGNRGRCAGCCRQLYTLVDLNNNKNIKTGYLLSMKDLNTSNYLKDLSFVDSLKIEGRMKDKDYVSVVCKTYRDLLNKKTNNNQNLKYIFNRTYTKGFMLGDTSKDITNIDRPNNFGYEIGEVSKIKKNKIWIKLIDDLNKGDQIRIQNDNVFKDVILNINKFTEIQIKNLKKLTSYAIVSCEEKVELNSKVYKIKDVNFYDNLETRFKNVDYEKSDIDFIFYARKNKYISLICKYENKKLCKTSTFITQDAKTNNISKEKITELLSRINDTPYKVRSIDLEIDDNIFIPVKFINELKREIINELNNIRLKKEVIKIQPKEITVNKYEFKDIEISVQVNNQEQYEVAKSLGIKHIYFKNIIRRNNENEPEIVDNNELLIGGYGSLEKYKDSNLNLVTDYSFNVSNYLDAALLSNLGAKRITLSLELSKDQINNLVNNYYSNFNTYPNLELIIYGRQTLMHSKYCVLKRLNMCNSCKSNKFGLKDKFAIFPLTFNDDCTINVLNSKILNLMDDIKKINGISVYRLIFTTENKSEVEKIIKNCTDILKNNKDLTTFDNLNQTRGHFNKKVL